MSWFPPYKDVQATTGRRDHNAEILRDRVKEFDQDKLKEYYRLTDENIMMLEENSEQFGERGSKALTSMREQRSILLKEIMARKRDLIGSTHRG